MPLFMLWSNYLAAPLCHNSLQHHSCSDTSLKKTIHRYFITLYFCSMVMSDDLQVRWWNLEAKLVERFGKKPDMETLLFLIGIQEFGQINPKFSKEQKQDLMHVAICSLLAPSGYYVYEGKDKEGWPHFRQLKQMPVMSPIEQENFLKDHVLLYFEAHGI